MSERPFRAGREGAEDRIAHIERAFAQGMLGSPAAASGRPGRVPFEVGEEHYALHTIGGVPQRLTAEAAPSDWAVRVDDWDLVVPVAPPRGVSTLRGCGLRLGGELRPLPQVQEMDALDEEHFPERIPNALLYFFGEHFGSPVGSYSYAMLFEDGRPSFAGDEPDAPERAPRAAVGGSYPLYLRYRTAGEHQLTILRGAGLDGNWKDLLTWHGLFDQPGFRRIYAGFPELPQDLWDYMEVLAEAAKLPEAAPEQAGDPGTTAPDGQPAQGETAHP